MTSKLKKLIAITPLIIWVAWWGWLQYAQMLIEKEVFEPNGMQWSVADQILQVTVQDEVINEIQKFRIQLQDAKGRNLYSANYEVDWDMGNRGFFRAMNVDSDAELELVLYQALAKNSVYLDVYQGQIVERPFEKASARAKKLADDWLDAHSPDVFAVGLWLLVTAAFYACLVIYLIGMWLYKMFRQTAK